MQAESELPACGWQSWLKQSAIVQFCGTPSSSASVAEAAEGAVSLPVQVAAYPFGVGDVLAPPWNSRYLPSGRRAV